MLSRKTTKPKTILQISLPSPVPPFFIYDFDLQHKRQPSSELTLSSPPLVEKNTQNNKKHASKRSSRLFLSAFPRFLSLSSSSSLSFFVRVKEKTTATTTENTRKIRMFFYLHSPLSFRISHLFFLFLSSLFLSLLSLSPFSRLFYLSISSPP